MNGKQIARAMFDALGGRVLVSDNGSDTAVLSFSDGASLHMWQDGSWYHTQYQGGSMVLNLPSARDWHELTTVVKTALALYRN